jgi:hypothetical protein
VLLDWLNEAKPPSSYGLDVGRAVSALAKSLSEGRDALAEVVLFHCGTAPNGLHQLLFFNDVSGVLNQEQKGFKGFEGERHRLAIAEQDAFARIDPKGREVVDVLARLAHDSLWQGVEAV